MNIMVTFKYIKSIQDYEPVTAIKTDELERMIFKNIKNDDLMNFLTITGGLKDLFYYQQKEKKIMQIYNFLQKNKINIFDIGCAGDIDPIFKNLINDNFWGKGYGFDGNSKEIEKLKKSNLKNTEYYNLLISDRNDFIDFFISGTVRINYARDDRVKLYNEKFVNKKIQSFTLD